MSLVGLGVGEFALGDLGIGVSGDAFQVLRCARFGLQVGQDGCLAAENCEGPENAVAPGSEMTKQGQTMNDPRRQQWWLGPLVSLWGGLQPCAGQHLVSVWSFYWARGLLTSLTFRFHGGPWPVPKFVSGATGKFVLWRIC